MKYLFISIAAFVLLSAAPAIAQKVTVTTKKETFSRPEPPSDYKKEFTIDRPQIESSSPEISAKIEKALAYEKFFDFTVEQERTEYNWLDAASYDVKYNDNGILSVALSVEGSAAYPSGSTKYAVVNTSRGTIVKASDVFDNETGLLKKLQGLQEKEIASTYQEIKKDPENADLTKAELFDGKQFKAEDLNNFSVTESGVTFYYNYEFPHVIQALEPEGTFTFTWQQLKPFIKPAGLLAQFVR